ncbi:MAG: cellulase family glycosylhydrolase [Taibaiella sp.]|nr:cellulase family glycosylhydrolase [Taibaiella sp.]
MTTLKLLDSALSKCIQEDLVPVLELHDITCGNDSAALVELSTWYLSPGILELINKYSHSLIINIANEALHVSWTGDAAAAKTKFINTYTYIVAALRAADIAVPIMIDGPDCGMSLQHLTDMGAALLENDPAHNLVFSTHAYWWAFSEMDSSVTREMIEEAVAEEIPLVIGEVANLQDDGTPCVYDLDFQSILHMCREFGIGWLAWSWDRDICSERQVTVAGSPDDLTAYGEVILHHPDFGIDEDVVMKSAYLINDGCSTSGVDNQKSSSPVYLYPNPAQEYVYIRIRAQEDRGWKYSIMDIHGRVVMSGDLHGSERIDVHSLLSGTYFIQVFNAQHWWTKNITIQR